MADNGRAPWHRPTEHIVCFETLMLRASMAGIEVPIPERKLVFPTPLRDDQDRLDLIQQHYFGQIKPREVRTADGRTWIETRGRAVAARALNDVGEACFVSWDIDANGPTHQTSQTPEQASAIAGRIYSLLKDEGVTPILVASGSGVGRQVIIVPEVPVPGAWAHWFACLVRDEGAEGGDVEIRPTSTTGTGSLLTLPERGWNTGPGGGRIILGDLEPVPLKRLRPFLHQWQQSVNTKKARPIYNRPSTPFCGNTQLATTKLDLRAVASRLSRITGASGDEIRVYCPVHDGRKALTVNLKKRIWRCFACEVGAAGDAAAFTLARHLLPGQSNRAVFDALRGIAVESSDA